MEYKIEPTKKLQIMKIGVVIKEKITIISDWGGLGTPYFKTGIPYSGTGGGPYLTIIF